MIYDYTELAQIRYPASFDESVQDRINAIRACRPDANALMKRVAQEREEQLAR